MPLDPVTQRPAGPITPQIVGEELDKPSSIVAAGTRHVGEAAGRTANAYPSTEQRLLADLKVRDVMAQLPRKRPDAVARCADRFLAYVRPRRNGRG